MDIKTTVELFKKFKSLEERKRSLDVNGLKEYLNTKKQIHQLDYSLDEVRKLNTEDEMVAYINSKIHPVNEQVSANTTEVKDEEVTKEKIIEQIESINPIKVEVETKTVEVNNNVDSNITVETEIDTNEQNEEKLEESESVISQETTEVADSDNEIEDDIQEHINKKEVEEIIETKEDNKEKDELKDLLEENLVGIVEEIKKIKKKVNENIVEIATGKNLSVVVGTNKIKITIPKSATVKMQHSLLLELYNQTFGLKDEELEDIEREAEVNELVTEPIEEVSMTESEENVIEEQKEIDIETQETQQVTEEVKESDKKDKPVIDEKTDKQAKRRTRTKGCSIRIPRNRVFIKPFNTNTENEFVSSLKNELDQFENEIEKAVAHILGLKYDEEKEAICKPENFDLVNITPEVLYKLRIVGLKFKAIKYFFSKLLNTSEDEAQDKLHQILINEPDERIGLFFGKKKLNEIRGQ